MRSIIDEIAAAETQADEIRQNAVVAARELMLEKKNAADAAYAAQEGVEREKTRTALEQAENEGAALTKTILADLAETADQQCAAAAEKLPEAVAYLMKKVQGLAC